MVIKKAKDLMAKNGNVKIGVVVLALTAIFVLGNAFHRYMLSSGYASREWVRENFVCVAEYQRTCDRFEAKLEAMHKETTAQIERMEGRLYNAILTSGGD